MNQFDELLTPDQLNAWLGDLFDTKNIDRTVAALVVSQDGGRGVPSSREAARTRLADAEARLRRFQTAIGAGVDPAALVESTNQAQAQRAAAQAELDNTPSPQALTEAEVYAMIDYFGDVGSALNRADPVRLEELYEALRLEMTYDAEARAVDVTIRRAVGVVNQGRVKITDCTKLVTLGGKLRNDGGA